MRINLPRMLAIGAIGMALAGIAVTPAQAAPGPDGQQQVIAAAGSDTILDVMNALTANYTNNATFNPDHDIAVNIPTLPNPTDPPFGPVQAQGPCPSRTYANKTVASPPNTFPAPNGSTDGKNALQGISPFPTDNLSSQCIDVARSSSPRGASDPASFEYYGFALDAVSWAAFNGGAAPATLTLQQIRDIYNCNVRNWNQVGGQNAAIIRYVPQAGSGTLAFFTGTVLGFNPPAQCADGSTLKIMEENHGNTVAAADRPAAIAPYSVAQWVAQANGAVPDSRGGAFIGRQNGQNPVSGPDANGRFSPNPNVINEGSSFIGVRTVFNVIDSRLGSAGQARRFVGDNSDGGAPGYLCSGTSEVVNTLTTFGFTPFTDDGSGNFCRQG